MTNSMFLAFGFAVPTAAYSIHRALPVFKYRGTMLVTCSENLKPAAIKIAKWRTAAAALFGRRHLEVAGCSHWPPRRDCRQDCLTQIEADPEGHRVWSVASRWYQGKKCVYCQKLIQPLTYFNRRPALLGADGKTLEWDYFPPEKLPETLSVSVAVCSDCHITETIKRLSRDRVAFRPWKRGGPIREQNPQNVNKEGRTFKPGS
jgi:hypothetical protein